MGSPMKIFYDADVAKMISSLAKVFLHLTTLEPVFDDVVFKKAEKSFGLFCFVCC